MMASQRTLAKPIKFSGTGLHSGKSISCELKPARPDTGIVFYREHPDGKCSRIPARFKNIGMLTHNTELRGDGASIMTVEHLLAALHGFGIDNCEIRINNSEVPVMDGSAAPFVLLLTEAGIVRQDAPRRFVRVTQPIRVSEEEMWIEAIPSETGKLSIEYSIDFDHPGIGAMRAEFSDDSNQFAHLIAPARTFGFLRDVENLRSKGLVLGANLQNVVVLDDHRVISEGLRFKDEFVRHKILDFWGDIVLLGRPLIAHVKANKAGHRLHAKLVETLLKTPDLLEPVDSKIRHRILHWETPVSDSI